MIPGMEPLHISESDLARDVRSILKRVETGGEVIVERDEQPVAVIRPAEPARRKISECIARMPADSTATIRSDSATVARGDASSTSNSQARQSVLATMLLDDGLIHSVIPE
jgi:antitoxin (DNA-binding transcriptional repressor) of toxin-antitoxin stability system